MVIISDGRVEMTEDEYDELLDASLFLSCLQAAGVDNWYWYDEAVEEFNKIKGEDE